MRIAVVYALPDQQRIFSAEVPAPASIETAIRASGVLDEFPEIDLARNRVGIFGRVAPLDAAVHEGDRVEIYRPLIADPKESRRARAARSRGRR